MSARAKALKNLYKWGKINKAGLEKAVKDGIITSNEYREITGQDLTLLSSETPTV